MNKPDSQQRIRQVAVVLTSVDEATARRLLGQFPAAQARLIRQQMMRLGQVSPREREEAMRIFQQLSGGGSPVKAQNDRQSASSIPSYQDDISPAEAALLQQDGFQDRFEASPNYQAQIQSNQPYPTSSGPATNPYQNYSQTFPTSNPSESFQPMGSGNDPFASATNYPVWQNYTGDQLAQMLAGERPIVIAAVVQQAPTNLGSAILQAMPVSLASAALAALPQLHTTDPTVLQDIYALLHEKLAEFQRQASPDNQGMLKLSALLTSIPSAYRKQVEHSLASTQPLLAHSLGISRTSMLVENGSTAPVNTAPVASSSATYSIPSVVLSNRLPEEVSPIANSVHASEESGDSTRSTQEPSFDDSIEFDQLSDLPLPDFAKILREIEPGTILVALTTASQRTVNRIESMIDPKEVKRLRSQVELIKRQAKSDVEQAQLAITRVAVALIREGKVAPVKNNARSRVLMSA